MYMLRELIQDFRVSIDIIFGSSLIISIPLPYCMLKFIWDLRANFNLPLHVLDICGYRFFQGLYAMSMNCMEAAELQFITAIKVI